MNVKTQGMSPMIDQVQISNNESQSDDNHVGDADDVALERPFDSTQCLFCNQVNTNFDDTISHMQKGHGFFVPQEHLQVDMETLIAYCHLIIFGYVECLSCGTQRSSPRALQLHMISKGHCKIDISEGSEFFDFFKPQTSSEDSTEAPTFSTSTSTSTSFVSLDSTTARLSSGKLMSHRSIGKPRSSKYQSSTNERLSQPTLNDASSSPSQSTESQLARTSPSQGSMTKAEKRDMAIANQLVNLRAEDRRSLVHLPASQQRAVLATQQKQMDKARNIERRMQSQVQAKGNKTLMKHFVSDVPGRKNG